MKIPIRNYPHRHGENKFKGTHHCSGAGMSKERLEELKHDEEDIANFERDEE